MRKWKSDSKVKLARASDWAPSQTCFPDYAWAVKREFKYNFLQVALINRHKRHILVLHVDTFIIVQQPFLLLTLKVVFFLVLKAEVHTRLSWLCQIWIQYSLIQPNLCVRHLAGTDPSSSLYQVPMPRKGLAISLWPVTLLLPEMCWVVHTVRLKNCLFEQETGLMTAQLRA